MTLDSRVPVTVLTGFLGSGKTTLLNRILTEQHGLRIAVIENEFGEIGIDQALVINADEEIFEMNNGCICCTVRGDLIRILGNLMRRRDRFDRILIETTGLADPAPVAQTFFVDPEIAEQLRLDAIVTLVDAGHIGLHLDDSSEAREQIAFADVLLLNKVDLVSPADLDRLEERLRAMNAIARIERTEMAKADIPSLLAVGGFDLGHALETKPTFLEPEYPFEWGGVFELSPGSYELVLQDGPDPEIDLALLSAAGDDAEQALANQVEPAVRAFSAEETRCAQGARLGPSAAIFRLDLDTAGEKTFGLDIERAGRYALFTQHRPDEFDLVLRRDGAPLVAEVERVFNPEHEHDDEVTSVGITLQGDLEGERLNRWLSKLLREQGVDIFRMKGTLAIADEPRRFVFQGVHMLFDGKPDRLWREGERENQLVFIGRNLDRAALVQGLVECLV